MARITVEDCLKKIDSQYDLVLLAKERTAQLNAGEPTLVPPDDDKNTVISLREIGEGKVSIKTLEDSAINKLRKQQDISSINDDLEEEQEDSFDKIYKGEVSKSGTAILPSKRVRRITEKIEVSSDKLKNKSEDEGLKETSSVENENSKTQNLEDKSEK